MAREAAVATCHPERKHYALGRCRACYETFRARQRTPEQQERYLAYERDWHRKNRDRRLAESKARYGDMAPPLRRETSLRSRYGISLKDYDRILAEQDGKCAICKREPKGLLWVDHDHDTGEVRGLLCPGCNSALGQFGSPELLDAAAAYLRRSS